MPAIWQGNLDNYLLDQLTKKIGSYEKWNMQYPGFGGYLPWYHVDDTGASLLSNWNDRVPSLDNGEMVRWLIFLYLLHFRYGVLLQPFKR